MRQSDLQADALAFMFAHQFVEQTIDEKDLHNPLAHDIQYPTKAPLSDRIIDRNEVAEKVVFCALADLHAQRRLIVTVCPRETLLGLRGLARLAQWFGWPRYDVLLQRDGSFNASPLNSALVEVFNNQLQPGSDFISEPRITVRALLKGLFRTREEPREPYQDILRWVGDQLIDEGYYHDSTDLTVGEIPIREAKPDLERMRDAQPRADELRERLDRFAQREPEIYEALRDSVAATMKEISTLHQRRYTL